MTRPRSSNKTFAVLAASALVLTAGLSTAACSNTSSDAAGMVSAGPVGANPVGPAPKDAKVPVIINLAPQVDANELKRRAANPATGPDRVTVAARIASEVGASDATISKAEQFFEDRGIPARVDPTRTYLSASLTANQAHEIFGVNLFEYRENSAKCGANEAADESGQVAGGCTFIAPEAGSRLQVPADLTAVLAPGSPEQQLSGFETRQILQASPKKRTSPASPANAQITNAIDPSSPPWWNSSGTPSGCAEAQQTGAFAPNQLAKAYGFPAASSKMEAQTIALLAFGQSVDQASVATYATCFGMKVPKIVVDDLAGSQASGGEATGDAQTLVAFGGGAIDTIQVLTGELSGASAADLLSAVSKATSLRDSQGKPVDIISISYAACESQFASSFGSTITATEAVLGQAATAGISVIAAAGDAGSSACAADGGGSDVAPAVNYPASSSWVTAVGGTNLLLSKSNGISASGVWNDAVLVQSGSQEEPFAGGGGGVSTVIDKPGWQAGPGVDLKAKRQVPDVAYVADMYPGIAGYCGSQVQGCLGIDWFANAGTSLATPMFAAAVAQYNARNNGDRLGFVNPKLYPAVASGKVKTFDIVTGNNIVGFATSNPFMLPDLDCCTAGPNFDKASGWGSVMIDSLLAGL